MRGRWLSLPISSTKCVQIAGSYNGMDVDIYTTERRSKTLHEGQMQSFHSAYERDVTRYLLSDGNEHGEA
jgi:hypothetical protein